MNISLNWFTRLDKKNRIAVVLSVLWAVVVPFFVIPYAGESGGPIEHFLWWGSISFVFVLGTALLD